MSDENVEDYTCHIKFMLRGNQSAKVARKRLKAAVEDQNHPIHTLLNEIVGLEFQCKAVAGSVGNVFYDYWSTKAFGKKEEHK